MLQQQLTAKKDGAVKDVVSDVTVVAPKKTAVIRPEMTQEDIDMILSELSSGDILTVSSGDYSINENVLNHKRIKIIVPGVTVKLLGGNYTRAQIISTVDTVILLDGNVIFYGQGSRNI